jgi:pimeloyl-ACP methyl ester carboxylesterase
MTATAPASRPATAPPLRRRGRRRQQIARLERPLLAGGVALVALHLLDVALSGAQTTIVGVVGIVGAAVAWPLLQPRLSRPTRAALGISVGLLTFGFGVVSHGLHVVNSGPDWRDVTGVGMIVGGLLLVAAGFTAFTARGRPPRRPGIGWRAAHGAGWLVGAAVVALVIVMPLALALMITHAPRWAIQESSLAIPHEEVGIETADGLELSAWYVPSTNRAAVLLSHGSGGSRERVAAHVRMLARHGYGVLALDNPGNGESEGHSNGLGNNVQPAIEAALGWLARRPDVDPRRIAGVGTSLGGEILLEAAARDPRLRAVVSDGAARPQDAADVKAPPPPERAMTWLSLKAVRGISGTPLAPSLNGLVPRIAPRPVLLIASGAPDEIPANRVYRDRGGPTVELWELPAVGHTAGLRERPVEYERRTTRFLDQALELSAR